MYAKAISPKSHTAALALCAIGGMFGLHRFYADKNKTAWLWLFTLGGFFIGWLYDMVMIITNSFTDGSGMYIVSDETIRKSGRPRVSTADAPTSPKSRTAALVLCLLGGYIGLHYFYVGRISKGITSIFTLNYLGVGWLLDIFLIALDGFEDIDGNILRSRK